MSKRINQTYFECYEFDVNVVLILIATYTYKYNKCYSEYK